MGFGANYKEFYLPPKVSTFVEENTKAPNVHT